MANEYIMSIENDKKTGEAVFKPQITGKLVRCKDCRYWDTIRQNDDLPDYHYCPIAKTFHRADFYCGGAERRTE